MKKKVVILGKGFVGWGGGIDFIRNLIKGLATNEDIEIFLLLAEEKKYVRRLKRYLRPYKYMLPKLLGGLKLNYKTAQNTAKRFDEQIETQNSAFKNEESMIKIIKYHDTKSSMLKVLRDIKADVVLPSIDSLGTDFPFKWVGYIFDFQHKYLPEFFTEEEIEIRNKNFRKIIDEASDILVNALAVKNDIKKFYPASQTRIHVLPFVPIVNAEFINTNADINKYDLPTKFFMISNQFWMHKDHGTAFAALSILVEKGIDDIFIVCTGNTIDYRFPQYFDDLKKKIVQLKIEKKVICFGHIPKVEQMEIMKKAIAVVQPTLFEGGPGGGATYDALALGIPVILSDIDVNKEIKNDLVTFFKARSSKDLAEKMMLLLKKYTENEIQRYDNNKLLFNSKQNMKLLGDKLRDL